MANKLTFYHQKRRDGGLRTGVEINGERVLENYEPGGHPQDSALLWFVDLRCSGERIPTDPQSVRRWLLDRSENIRGGLRQLSKDVVAGIDKDWPIRRELPVSDVRMAIYCSAMRRLSGREISEVLSGLEKRWPKVVQSLDSYAVLANG